MSGVGIYHSLQPPSNPPDADPLINTPFYLTVKNKWEEKFKVLKVKYPNELPRASMLVFRQTSTSKVAENMSAPCPLPGS